MAIVYMKAAFCLLLLLVVASAVAAVVTGKEKYDQVTLKDDPSLKVISKRGVNWS